MMIKKLLIQTFNEWQKDNASMFAAALTYYTLFSLTPLLVIIVGVVGIIFGQQAVEGQIVGQIQYYIGQESAVVIETLIKNARFTSSGIIFTIISLFFFIYGSTRVFVQLKRALNIIWGISPKKEKGHVHYAVQSRLLSVFMVGVIILMLFFSIIMSSVLAAFGAFLSVVLPFHIYFMQLLNFVISFASMTVLFAIVYKVLPDTKISWSDVWNGAAVTTVLFILGNYLIGLYLGNIGIGSVYGAAGSFVVLLLWLYYSSLIFFFGAEFTEVYARLYGSHKRKKIFKKK